MNTPSQPQQSEQGPRPPAQPPSIGADNKMGLGEKTEALLRGVSIVVSSLASVTALLVALSGDAFSSAFTLAAASALCIGCLVVLYFWIKPKRGTSTARTFAVGAVSCLAILGGAWLFAFRDEVRFSPFFTSFSHSPSVLVSDSVARCVLRPKTAGAPPERIVSFVNDLVKDAHRTRICSPVSCDNPEIAFILGGTLSESKVSLELSAPFPAAPSSASSGSAATVAPALPQGDGPPPDPKSLADVLREVDSPLTLMANAFDEGTIRIAVETAPDTVAESLQGALDLAQAARGVRSGHVEAAAGSIEGFLAQARLLTSAQGAPGWVLEGLLFAMGYYDRAKDWPHAERTTDLGLELFPNEPRMEVAAAYVRWGASGSGTPAASAPPDGDAPLANVLRAVIDIGSGDFMEASALLERAGRASGTTISKHRRFWIDTGAAYLASVANGDPIARGRRITDRAESALAAWPNVRLLRVLDAFGLVLAGSAGQGHDLFDDVRRQSHDATLLDCDYWRAYGEAEAGQSREAIRILDVIAREPSPPAAALGLLSELTWEARRTRDDADRSEKLAKQALHDDPDEPKANRVLGFIGTARIPELPWGVRKEVAIGSLKNFDRTVHRQGYDADLLAAMSDLYRTIWEATKAEVANRKALDLRCKTKNDGLACRLNRIDELLNASNPKEAGAKTNEMLLWMSNHPVDDENEDLHRVEMVNRVAIAWYEHDRLDEAKQLYGTVLDAVDQMGDIYWKVPEKALVSCNLGFVYFDELKSVDAVNAFERSVSVAPDSPDCQAGLAVALKDQGRDADALAAYAKARSLDETYGPNSVEILRNINFWSERAVKTLLDLARKYDQTKKGT